jgi:hypothetical protein
MRETLAGVDGLWTLGVIMSWSSLRREEVVILMPSVSIDSLMLQMIDL